MGLSNIDRQATENLIWKPRNADNFKSICLLQMPTGPRALHFQWWAPKHKTLRTNVQICRYANLQKCNVDLIVEESEIFV